MTELLTLLLMARTDPVRWTIVYASLDIVITCYSATNRMINIEEICVFTILCKSNVKLFMVLVLSSTRDVLVLTVVATKSGQLAGRSVRSFEQHGTCC